MDGEVGGWVDGWLGGKINGLTDGSWARNLKADSLIANFPSFYNRSSKHIAER